MISYVIICIFFLLDDCLFVSNQQREKDRGVDPQANIYVR